MVPETHPREPAFSAGKLWPVAAGSFVAVLGLAYGLRGGIEDRRIVTNQHTLSVSVHQLQQQVKDLSERLAALSALQQNKALIIEPNSKRSEEPPWKTLQRQLAEQSRKISLTQQELEQARRGLERKLGALRDTHLFQLTRSRQFRRTGPVSLALRKVDTKHKRYDIDLLIKGVKLEKRNVNLFEPILFQAGDQPLELVVNEIATNRVKGYVSVARPQQASR